MIIVKHEFLEATVKHQQIGSLYLMYAMYFKQPTLEYCKFRFTVNEWMSFCQFYRSISEAPDCNEPKLIFWKLLQNDAMRFVVAEHEYGFERFMHKDHMDDVGEKNDFKSIGTFIESELATMKDEMYGIIPALEMLQVGYNEMKEHLDMAGPSKGLLPSTSIMSNIMTGMEKIEKIFSSAVAEDKAIVGRKRKLHREMLEVIDSDLDEDIMTSIGAKRACLKKKAFTGESIPDVKISVTEDDDILKVTRQIKTYTRDKKRELRRRTVVKQLNVPQ